jgi:alkyl hydroperoxide reductase subunit AhpF
LAVLGDGNAFADRIDPDVRQRLAQLRAPALVKVYITPHCPFCPTTVSILLGLAACSDQVRMTVIDGEMFPDAAQKDRINAAPTVILDDQFRWTGSVDAGELVTLMLDRD